LVSKPLPALLIGFVLAIVSFFAATLYSHRAARAIDTSSQRITTVAIPSVERLAGARTDLLRLRTALRHYLFDPAAHRREIIDARAALAARLDQYLALPFYADEAPLWEEVHARLEAYDRLQTTVLSQPSQTFQALLPSALPIGTALDSVDFAAQKLVAFNARRAAEDATRITAFRAKAERIELILDALSALLTLAVAFLAVRAVRQYAQVLHERNRLQSARAERLEQAGRMGEQRLRLLIDSIKDYAVFMLDTEGRVATWSPGAQRIKQYAADEIIGRHFSTFYPEEDVRAGKCEMELRVATETGRFEEEGWRVRKDGSQFWANVVISAVRDHTQALIGFSKVTRDLTERKKIEQERAARLASEQANRAKDDFLAMLGHELRTPLSAITTALHLMRLRGDTRTARERDVIGRQITHITRLVDDLLDVSRVARGKVDLAMKHLALADIVARAIEMATPLLEQRHHSLDVRVATAGLFVLGDETRMAQVVGNLLTNAAKYTEPGGSITIEAAREANEIVLCIRDNGIGIAPELLPNLFDLFVQGENRAELGQGGLGLGLALVRSLVELHGGTVAARSDGPGKGSEFIVKLPAAPAEVVSDADVETGAAPPPPTPPRRILVVDDNTDAAELVSEVLRALGHDVATTHDGEQALVAAARFHPQIAIVDIGLPLMDGYELAGRLRSLDGAEAPYLIALTGYGQSQDRERARAAGFDEHMVKPVDPDALIRMIAMAPAGNMPTEAAETAPAGARGGPTKRLYRAGSKGRGAPAHVPGRAFRVR
jgi:PAS domain S-box-containing protein